MSTPAGEILFDSRRFRAALFDLDGVLTRTAAVHVAAWKALFDAYLCERAGGPGRFEPFDPDADYRRYVDGKPRYDGVVCFLQSRGIVLPLGDPADAPGDSTICALGNRKNRFFNERLNEGGVEVYPSSLVLIRALRRLGIGTAVVSASRNCRQVLAAADLTEHFDAHVDGVEAARLGLPGKPAPDTFLEAARRLDVEPGAAVVFEDARAGVEAGRRGGFGWVVGLDRTGDAAGLRARGAHTVVSDLDEMAVR